MPTGVYKRSENANKVRGLKMLGNKVHLGSKASDELRKKLSLVHGGIGGTVEERSRYRNWQKNLWSKRKKEASGGHSFEEWELLKAQYNWTCPSCQKKESEIKLTQDHIIPLSRGGSENIENIQPLCKSCNCKKHTKIIKY